MHQKAEVPGQPSRLKFKETSPSVGSPVAEQRKEIWGTRRPGNKNSIKIINKLIKKIVYVWASMNI